MWTCKSAGQRWVSIANSKSHSFITNLHHRLSTENPPIPTQVSCRLFDKSVSIGTEDAKASGDDAPRQILSRHLLADALPEPTTKIQSMRELIMLISIYDRTRGPKFHRRPTLLISGWRIQIGVFSYRFRGSSTPRTITCIPNPEQ